MYLFAAEMSHFHDQKVSDFKNMMQHFLQEQISHHHRVRFTFCNFSFGWTPKEIVTDHHNCIKIRVNVNELLNFLVSS